MLVLSAHTQFGPDGHRADRLRDHHGIHPGQIVHRASEPSPSNRWGAVLANNSPGQTSRPNDGITDTPKEWQRSHAPRDAPEPDSLCKEQSRPLSQPLNGVITQPRTPCLSHVIKPNSGHSAIQLVLPSEALNQWERLSSFLTKRLTPRLDRGAHAVCFANGGGGDDRDRTGDPLLAKQVLSQLSYAPVTVVRLSRQFTENLTTDN